MYEFFFQKYQKNTRLYILIVFNIVNKLIKDSSTHLTDFYAPIIYLLPSNKSPFLCCLHFRRIQTRARSVSSPSATYLNSQRLCALEFRRNFRKDDKTNEHKVNTTMIAVFDIKNNTPINQTTQAFQFQKVILE